MYKLIATDLDGTLLRSDKTISQETIETIKKLDQKGVIFVPSTGRTHKELPEPIANLPFLHYGMCVNGGGVYDYRENKYIHEVNIPNQKAIEVLEFVKTIPVVPSLVVHGQRYLPANENGEFTDFIQRNALKSILSVSLGVQDFISFLQENKEGVQKFLIYPMRADQRDEMIEILRKKFSDLEITYSGPLYIEVNGKGVDKGKGLQVLCNHLGISIEETIAFGDAPNDLALLDAAGHAVVMANGTEQTKEHADEIAPSNDEDGLRKVLERIYQL